MMTKERWTGAWGIMKDIQIGKQSCPYQELTKKYNSSLRSQAVHIYICEASSIYRSKIVSSWSHRSSSFSSTPKLCFFRASQAVFFLLLIEYKVVNGYLMVNVIGCRRNWGVIKVEGRQNDQIGELLLQGRLKNIKDSFDFFSIYNQQKNVCIMDLWTILFPYRQLNHYQKCFFSKLSLKEALHQLIWFAVKSQFILRSDFRKWKEGKFQYQIWQQLI